MNFYYRRHSGCKWNLSLVRDHFFHLIYYKYLFYFQVDITISFLSPLTVFVPFNSPLKSADSFVMETKSIVKLILLEFEQFKKPITRTAISILNIFFIKAGILWNKSYLYNKILEEKLWFIFYLATKWLRLSYQLIMYRNLEFIKRPNKKEEVERNFFWQMH